MQPKLKWKLVKVAIAVGLLVATLGGSGVGATVSAHGKEKGHNPPLSGSGPSGQPFIITFD